MNDGMSMIIKGFIIMSPSASVLSLVEIVCVPLLVDCVSVYISISPVFANVCRHHVDR